MPLQPTTYQFDLFSSPCDAETAQMPQWQTLPEQTRRTLTKLMVRLICEYARNHDPALKATLPVDYLQKNRNKQGARFARHVTPAITRICKVNQ
ncbi:hypothetical protein [Shumkonia mesophila]|uniref:hypothetical protein n=1 Tax=Shumkonia mesophila TaxID=2838854 RepID=UPI0029343210|nr:hypothetical protein [Shumkonia mesophila]